MRVLAGARRAAVAAVLVAACSQGGVTTSPTAAPPASNQASDAPTPGSLPSPASLPDGSVAAVGDAMNGGLLYIVWDGTAERIEQPAPMDRKTLREIGLRRVAPVERFTARPEPDPRTFWVVFPPSGPRARLHLAVANRLYPVVTVPAHQSQIDALEPPSESLLNRMRPAG